MLIVDGMGFLSSLYQYCRLAYIGGGFGKGIHNILEAVTFGKPVIFGPNYQSFPEAVELVKNGGAFSIRNQGDLINYVNKFIKSEAEYNLSSAINKEYIETKKGATQQILQKFHSICQN